MHTIRYVPIQGQQDIRNINCLNFMACSKKLTNEFLHLVGLDSLKIAHYFFALFLPKAQQEQTL